jgi:hypothetical protein
LKFLSLVAAPVCHHCDRELNAFREEKTKNQAFVCVRIQIYIHRNFSEPQGAAGKSLARPGRKQATATKLGIYSMYSPRNSTHLLNTHTILMQGHGLDWAVSGNGQTASYCECSDGLRGSIKFGKVLVEQGTYSRLKTDSAIRNYITYYILFIHVIYYTIHILYAWCFFLKKYLSYSLIVVGRVAQSV